MPAQDHLLVKKHLSRLNKVNKEEVFQALIATVITVLPQVIAARSLKAKIAIKYLHQVSNN